MCDVLPCKQIIVTVSCVQEFVDSFIEFILFLLSAPIASLVSLFSLETKPSLRLQRRAFVAESKNPGNMTENWKKVG